MPEKHIGKVVQVMGPVLDIRFADGELPELGGLGLYEGRVHVDVFRAADGHLREWRG